MLLSRIFCVMLVSDAVQWDLGLKRNYYWNRVRRTTVKGGEHLVIVRQKRQRARKRRKMRSKRPPHHCYTCGLYSQELYTITLRESKSETQPHYHTTVFCVSVSVFLYMAVSLNAHVSCLWHRQPFMVSKKVVAADSVLRDWLRSHHQVRGRHSL